MTNEKIWFETAKSHLRTAKKNLKIEEHLIAYTEAIVCAEVALKAVLIKNKKFSNQDKHHKIPILFEKIKSEKCLPSNLTLQLGNLIGDKNSGGLGYIDILAPPDFMIETSSGHHVKLRYPVGTFKPNEIVSTYNASEKIKQSDQLMKNLSHLFIE